MRRLVMAFVLGASCATAIGADATTAAPGPEAAALAAEFVGLLKPQLKQALTEGGPTHAIAVCADIAPGIADSLSAQSGWLVRRVSLKSRNASRAVPDSWERKVLLEFDKRQAAGEQPAELHFGEVVNGQYRYMQAQVVEPVCLVCHGKGLSDEVQATLKEYYPDDWATGYSLGEVRGAISLSGKL